MVYKDVGRLGRNHKEQCHVLGWQQQSSVTPCGTEEMSMGSSQSDRAISQELQSWTMDAAGLSPHREGDERISPFVLLSFFSELSC